MILGQKGIGFKSVFRVTDAPEIHSNGFHIKFDASSGSNGYILPHWIYNWKSDRRLSYQPCKHINLYVFFCVFHKNFKFLTNKFKQMLF